MPPLDRSLLRNVEVEFTSSPGITQGGLCAAPNLTKQEFIQMLNVAFIARGGFEVRPASSNTPVAETDDLLFPLGKYFLQPVIAGEQVRKNDERFYPRTLSGMSSTPTTDSFRNQVRHRDGRCVITGQVNLAAHVDMWRGFQAAHIFPRALNDIFCGHGFSQLITYHRSDPINSPQNGLLLRSDIHELWDDYSLAVNPDNNYRVQSFSPNASQHHGNVLQDVCRLPGDEAGILDALLRWNFQQAVLANMRGAGEPSFEFDFPPGSDMMGEIRAGPQAAERMEAELFGRLHGWHGASPPKT
jgi:hypothetical protein